MGTLTRREALGILGASIVAGAQETALRFTALDHIETSAPDSAKSAAFYASVFGGPIWKNNKGLRRYVKLGPRYIAIENAREPLGIDHFSAGIAGFQIADIHRFLQQRGIEYNDYPSGRDLNVTDPDGIHVQLSADDTWAQLSTGTASPETAASEPDPIFQATGIDHILLNVADPQKSEGFYEKFFGKVTQRNNNRIWFQVGKSRVGLLKTPAGAKPGVNHFCVSAAAFDPGAAAKKLMAAGAKIEIPETSGSTELRDPDGLLVQVMPV